MSALALLCNNSITLINLNASLPVLSEKIESRQTVTRVRQGSQQGFLEVSVNIREYKKVPFSCRSSWIHTIFIPY